MYTLEVNMSWLIRIFGSSIGKKLLMAITGLSFIGFLCAHLTGNLTLYMGGTVFNTYAEKLHSLGPILTVFEFGLLALALIHVTTGIILFVQNLKARSVPYENDRRAGGLQQRTSVHACLPQRSRRLRIDTKETISFARKNVTFK